MDSSSLRFAHTFPAHFSIFSSFLGLAISAWSSKNKNLIVLGCLWVCLGDTWNQHFVCCSRRRAHAAFQLKTSQIAFQREGLLVVGHSRAAKCLRPFVAIYMTWWYLPSETKNPHSFSHNTIHATCRCYLPSETENPHVFFTQHNTCHMWSPHLVSGRRKAVPHFVLHE